MREDFIFLLELVSVELAHTEALIDSLSIDILELNIKPDTFDEWVSTSAFHHEVVELAEYALAARLWIYKHALNHVHEAALLNIHLVRQHGRADGFLLGIIFVPCEQVAAEFWILDAVGNSRCDDRLV